MHAHSLDVKVAGGRRDWRRDPARTGSGAAAVLAVLALLFAGGDEQLDLVMAPGQVVFAAQAAGSTSAAQQVTLTNRGPSAVEVSRLALSNPASFRVARTDCPAGVVEPGLTCSIFIEFQPLTAGSFDGALQGSGSTARVELRGTGVQQIADGRAAGRATDPDLSVEPTPPVPPTPGTPPTPPEPPTPPPPNPPPATPSPQPGARFERASYEMKGLVGDSQTVDVVLANTGETVIGPVRLRMEAGASAFAPPSDGCILGGPGTTCTATVRFAPSEQGTHAETLVAETDRELARTRLTGIASPKLPEALLSRTRIEFTRTGEQVTVVVQNVGSAPLQIGNVAVDNTRDFEVRPEGCRAGTRVEPTKACALFVRFTSKSRAKGRVTVSHNASPEASAVELAALTAPQFLRVPRLTGSTRRDALRDIVRAQFTVGDVVDVAQCDSIDRVIAQQPPRDSQALEGSPIDVRVASTGPNPAIVPDVRRLSQADAERRIRAERLQPRAGGREETDSVPSGAIAQVEPRPGTRLAPDCPVTLRVAVPVPKVPVPSFLKQSLADVRQALKGGAAGFFAPFRLGDVRTSDGGRVPAGEDTLWFVVGQSPEAGTMVPRPSGLAVGTRVNLTVARPSVSRIN